MDDVIIEMIHLRASIKLLSAECRARADHLHIMAKAPIWCYFVDIIAEKFLDNLYHLQEEHN